MDKEKLSSKKEYEKALKTAANILNLKVTIVKDRSGEVTYYTMRKKPAGATPRMELREKGRVDELKIKLEPWAHCPTKAHADDAGLDLYAPNDVVDPGTRQRRDRHRRACPVATRHGGIDCQ